MAKLVAPIYQLSPKQERILQFKGWNAKSVISDGEMRDMFNLSSDEYPCLYQRKPRGIYETGIPNLAKPTAMLVKHKKLAIISDGNFYYDGVLYPSLQLSDETQMVAINTRICFFPEKKFFNVMNGSVGGLDASVSAENVTATVTSSTITFTSDVPNLANGFKVGDAVSVAASEDFMTVSAVIDSITETSVTFPDDTFIDITAAGEESREVTLSAFRMERSCPDLDYVIESNNRLWGVSNADNVIYACKLGDPTNWAYFQNTTQDSYYAEQGTDGEWTGCAAYSTHLLFFKEDYIHKVYGNRPANYTVESAQCHALEKGSSKSIAVINETVLYKSRLGIMAYAGGTPFLISENFGTERFTDAIAGTDGLKYFVSVLRDGKPLLLVYDMEKYLWHKEDELRVRDFCYHNGKLLYIDKSDNLIYEMGSDMPLEAEKKIKWMAELGPFDEYVEERKVYSQVQMRLSLEEYSKVIIYISVDGGEWERVWYINDFKEKSQFVPIVPRRCNKFTIRLEGEGRCKIESLVRCYRNSTKGKDVR